MRRKAGSVQRTGRLLCNIFRREYILAVRSRNFCLVEGVLYNKGIDGIWRHGIREDEKDTVIREAHYGTAGGLYDGDVTAWKIWQAGLW